MEEARLYTEDREAERRGEGQRGIPVYWRQGGRKKMEGYIQWSERLGEGKRGDREG